MVHTSGPPTLFTNVQLFDQRAIFRMIRSIEVVEQSSAATDQGQQPASAAMVLGVHLEMLGQIRDPLGQHRDLQLGRTRIRLVATEFLDQLSFAFSGNRHAQSTIET